MSWYKSIFKIAGAKDKIQKYKVDDPSLKLFIYKYENSIPWDKIQSSENIQSYIKEALLPELNKKIDPKSGDNNYMKGLNIEKEYKNNPNDPHVAKAYDLNRHDPEAAKEYVKTNILAPANRDKRDIFNGWWNYVNNDEIYSSNPAFIYSALKPMIDVSPATQKNGPPPLNAEVLSHIWDEVNQQGSTQINVLKRYKKISSKLDKLNMEVMETEKGNEWIKIPSKKNDPKNFSENADKLKRYSTGTGWCTAVGRAVPYLSDGDFWLYLEDGNVKVAIRQIENRVQEIRGLNNQEKNLLPYWEPVLDHLETIKQTNKDFEYKDNSFYKKLSEIAIMNADLENDTSKYNSLVEIITNEPAKFKLLSDNNKKTPQGRQLAQIAASKYNEILEELLRGVETATSDYDSRFSKFQNMYKNIDDNIKPLLPPDIQERVVVAHKKLFMNNPLEFDNFPTEIQSAISPEEQISSWQRYIQEDPYRYNDKRIPNNIKSNVASTNLVDSWVNLINFNPRHLDNLPPELIQKINEQYPNFVNQKIIEDFKISPLARERRKGYFKIKRMKDMGFGEDIIIQSIVDAVNKTPNLIQYVPKIYQETVRNQMGEVGVESLVNKAKIDVIRNPLSFQKLEPEIQNKLVDKYPQEVGFAFAKTKNLYGRNLNLFWNSLPEQIKFILPDQTISEVIAYYKNLITQNPDAKSMVPPDLQLFLLASKNWYKLLKLAQATLQKPSYLEIGHSGERLDEDITKPNYMWIYFNGNVLVKEETEDEPGHDSAFEHLNIISGKTYTGRYDSQTKYLSLHKPVLGIQTNRDVPSSLVYKLYKKFPDITQIFTY